MSGCGQSQRGQTGRFQQEPIMFNLLGEQASCFADLNAPIGSKNSAFPLLISLFFLAVLAALVQCSSFFL